MKTKYRMSGHNENIVGTLISEKPSPPDIPKKWYTASEAAMYLRKSIKTVYNLRNKGRLGGVRSGGSGALLFTLVELDIYVLGQGKRKRNRI